MAEEKQEVKKERVYTCKCGWKGGFFDLDHTTSGADCPSCGGLAIMTAYPSKPEDFTVHYTEV
jgi:predicted RNA-binding Zn-ribbon protein involved in translation (DUF1610 family)